MTNRPDVRLLLSRRHGEETTPEIEIARFEALPAAKRKLVEDRLPVLDAYMTAAEAGRGDAAGAAADLSITPRSLYRLVARTREIGAVGAIAPVKGAGRKARSDAGGTLSESARKAITEQILRAPYTKPVELLQRARAVDPTATASSVRRFALQARSNLDPMGDHAFGGSLLLDEAALDIPVEERGRVRWLTCAFLVDEDTGAVVGWSPSGGGNPGLRAVRHALQRIGNLVRYTLPLAPGLTKVTWVVPIELLPDADRIAAQGSKMRPPIAVEVVAGGRFGRGERLSRTLGGSIGTADILVRATADPVIRAERPVEALPLEDALSRLQRDAALSLSWLSRWEPPRQKSPKPPTMKRVRELQRLMTRIVELFSPLLSEGDMRIAEGLVAAIGTDVTVEDLLAADRGSRFVDKNAQDVPGER